MQQKETLSAFMDGHDVESEFIATLCDDPDLKQKWTSYHAIRSVMHGDDLILGADFSAKMEALLENEEIESSSVGNATEGVAKPKGMLLKLKRWNTQLIQAGVAASVCLVAVVGVNMMNSGDEIVQAPVLQTQPFTDSLKPVSYNAPERDALNRSQLEDQQNKINQLLQGTEVLQQRPVVSGVTLTEEEKAKARTSSVEAEKASEAQKAN